MTTDRQQCRRQLLIGLDAAEWDLVLRWVGEGKLPNFQRLMEEGTRAELSTTAAQLPDTVWAAVYTGTNPAKFEKFFYVQYDATTMGLRHVADDEIQRPPFWDLLSEAGVRVGVVDPPKFKLSKNLNGFHLANWGAHATKTARASNPPTLLQEVQARFGSHPVGDCDAVDPNPKALSKLADRVVDGVKLRGQVFRWLMRDRPWEVFFAGFSEPHCIGHHFWHWLDPDHPRHGEVDTHGLSDAMERVYRAIDREIGEMLTLIDDQTLCLVFAGHGMGPIYHASWNLPEMLELLGYGAREPGSKPVEQGRKARVNPWRVVRLVVPGWLQYRIKNSLPKSLQDKLLFKWYAGGQKWEGARAFAIPNNDSVGAIRVSVRGRDRDGVVEPGAEYEQVCRDLAEAFRELTDPETGRPVVQQVTLTHEVFQGPFIDQLPDLTILWEQSFPWQAVKSPRFGTLAIPQQDSRSGSHRPHGFVLAKGPGVAANRELKGHSIYDIAPTVLAAAGVPVPMELDGEPLPLTQSAVPA